MLGQLAVIGGTATLLGLYGVAGAVGTDWVTRSVGVLLVVLGITLTFVSVRRLEGSERSGLAFIATTARIAA